MFQSIMNSATGLLAVALLMTSIAAYVAAQPTTGPEDTPSTSPADNPATAPTGESATNPSTHPTTRIYTPVPDDPK